MSISGLDAPVETVKSCLFKTNILEDKDESHTPKGTNELRKLARVTKSNLLEDSRNSCLADEFTVESYNCHTKN